jgi:H+/Cl- antiporter ClcA
VWIFQPRSKAREVGYFSARDYNHAQKVPYRSFNPDHHRGHYRQHPQMNNFFRLDPDEHTLTLRMLIKWTILASMVGVMSGIASALFLVSLQWATNFRLANTGLLYLLPLAGFGLGWLYHRFGKQAARGNNLVIDELHTNKTPIPLRMAPMVLLGTIITHLFGGSAGREGTAVQMASSLADWLRRVLNLSDEDRRLMIMAGISGGFGSVFGTPLAGFVFGLEVQHVGRMRYEGVIPCLVAAIVGDLTTRALGVTHSHYPTMATHDLDLGLLIRVALAGIIFGIVSLLFIEVTHGIKYVAKQTIQYPPLRPVVGGLIVIGLTLLIGTQDYLGLSLPLIQRSLSGGDIPALAFLLKLTFTAVTLGMGFMGGEVTPLFVIGSTLGVTVGKLLGVDPIFMAGIGFVAVFAGASNTPLACMLMGVELFGSGSILYLAIGCFVAYLASGHRSIYMAQRIGTPKAVGVNVQPEETLEAISDRRAGR